MVPWMSSPSSEGTDHQVNNIGSVVEQYRFCRCGVPTDFRIWLLFASKQGRGERQEQRESLSQPTQSKYLRT